MPHGGLQARRWIKAVAPWPHQSGDPLQARLAADLRVTLAGEHPADGARTTQPPRHTDQLRLTVSRAFAAVRSRIGEIGRTAQHRHREARAGNGVIHPVEVTGLKTRQEPVVHLLTLSFPAGSTKLKHGVFETPGTDSLLIGR
jgi:hypothetical protein